MALDKVSPTLYERLGQDTIERISSLFYDRCTTGVQIFLEHDLQRPDLFKRSISAAGLPDLDDQP